MKIKVKNLGILRQAEFELGDMTIICGGNNTGKTYATYALYGFLQFWRNSFFVEILPKNVDALLSEGSIRIDLSTYQEKVPEIINDATLRYSKQLSSVFASSEKLFSDSKFSLSVAEANIHSLEEFEETYVSSTGKNLFQIKKEKGSTKVDVSFLHEKESTEIPPKYILQRLIGDALKKILFGDLFKNPFIASAERTGAAIFCRELNFVRNRSEKMGSMKRNLQSFDVLDQVQVYTDYALPVRDNVDFIRQLEDIAKKESFISKKHPEIISDFGDIIGGKYKVVRDELYFVPNCDKHIRITMDESSSAVRSLLDIGFYLRHAALPGDLLMVDEPELNLHPENQRRVARLFARLMNIGVKVFITTHSDYIIKELNTLIMLNHNHLKFKRIMEENGYTEKELVSADKIKVYIAEEGLVKTDENSGQTRCQTLVEADINSEFGIEARSFDTTIDTMNSIQEAIMFSCEEK